MFVSHSCITHLASITVQWLRRWVPSVQTTRVSSGRCDKLFENPKALSDDNITSYAQAVKLDMGKFSECYKGEKHKAKIQKQQSSVVKLGARGTPAFFINGRFPKRSAILPSFKALIDEELAKAKKSGIAKKDYYKKAIMEKGSKKI